MINRNLQKSDVDGNPNLWMMGGYEQRKSWNVSPSCNRIRPPPEAGYSYLQAEYSQSQEQLALQSANVSRSPSLHHPKYEGGPDLGSSPITHQMSVPISAVPSTPYSQRAPYVLGMGVTNTIYPTSPQTPARQSIDNWSSPINRSMGGPYSQSGLNPHLCIPQNIPPPYALNAGQRILRPSQRPHAPITYDNMQQTQRDSTLQGQNTNQLLLQQMQENNFAGHYGQSHGHSRGLSAPALAVDLSNEVPASMTPMSAKQYRGGPGNSQYVASGNSAASVFNSHRSSPTPVHLANMGPDPPAMRRFRSRAQLMPMSIKSKYRRALPDGGFVSPLIALTTQLASTYHICDSSFNYNLSRNPRRVLTEPSEGKLNNGCDNEDSDYILYVNDVLGCDDNRRYLVLNVLGKGTFGQVVKCQNMATKEVVAVKIIKNKPAYFNQSMMEVSILEHIQENVDKEDKRCMLRLKDKFVHKEHLCLVFELLSMNLYEIIKKNNFHGLDINLVRVFAQQMLDALSALKDAGLIHCDLKPENILLRRNDSTAIKIIDFGSACHERQTVYTYIQSRFYRSPEVILGLPYTSSIDMWSLGCIIAELFIGLPIFPGTSEYDQWSRIVTSLGIPPNWMLEMGRNTDRLMKKYVDQFGMKHYRLRTLEEHNREFKADEKPSKQYLNSSDIKKIIMTYPMRDNMSKQEVAIEQQQREALYDFIRGLLIFNPFERWTPRQALAHPFITQRSFAGPYTPTQTLPVGPVSSSITPSNQYATVPHPRVRQGWQPQMGTQPRPLQQCQPSQQAQSQSQQMRGIDGSQQMVLPQDVNKVPAPPAVPPNLSLKAQHPGRTRLRAATISYTSDGSSVPAPIQRAAALVDPADRIYGGPGAAFISPSESLQNR